MFVADLFQLLHSSLFDSAGADELDGAPEFVLVEPGAVRNADIDDDVRFVCKLFAIHEFVADGAGNVANRCFQLHRLVCRTGSVCNECLLLAVGCDLVQAVQIDPDAFAARAFEQAGGSYRDVVHSDLTARAAVGLASGDFDATSFRAAVRTELGAGEHYAEAGRTRDGGESRVAEIAAGGVGGDGGAAGWAVEGFDGHGFDRLSG